MLLVLTIFLIFLTTNYHQKRRSFIDLCQKINVDEYIKTAKSGDLLFFIQDHLYRRGNTILYPLSVLSYNIAGIFFGHVAMIVKINGKLMVCQCNADMFYCEVQKQYARGCVVYHDIERYLKMYAGSSFVLPRKKSLLLNQGQLIHMGKDIKFDANLIRMLNALLKSDMINPSPENYDNCCSWLVRVLQYANVFNSSINKNHMTPHNIYDYATNTGEYNNLLVINGIAYADDMDY